jgi:hypothetical protein
VARGFQEGRDGKSYAIQTIVAPGRKRSTSLAEIEDQFVELFVFAGKHPELEFLMTPVGARLAGYTAAEMKATLERACCRFAPPPNIIIPADLYAPQEKTGGGE